MSYFGQCLSMRGRSARGLTSYENLLAMRFDLEAIASKRLVVQVLSS
jgi:hypothetical protein